MLFFILIHLRNWAWIHECQFTFKAALVVMVNMKDVYTMCVCEWVGVWVGGRMGGEVAGCSQYP